MRLQANSAFFQSFQHEKSTSLEVFMSTLNGKNLGKYRMLERLGRGGMADVYKAYHPRLDRYVAVKVMHSHLVDDSDFLTRFEREARAVANLRHPNIVQVFDFDIEDEIYFMVMEFIEGGTLKDQLQKLALTRERMPLAAALTLFQQVAGALEYAHQLNMLHRDIKPANILLDEKGRAMLADFGIARIVTDKRLTATGTLIGTPAYMAPEQGQGGEATVASEVYSLGVILYEMVTGQVPFDADTPLAILLMHVNDPLPLPREFVPEIPEPLERVILRSMAKNPEDRFESVAEMSDSVQQVLVSLSEKTTMAAQTPSPLAEQETEIAPVIPVQEETLAPAPDVVPVEPEPQVSPPTTKKRGKGWLVILGVVLLLAIVGGALYAFKIIPSGGATEVVDVDQPPEIACSAIPECIAEAEASANTNKHIEAIRYLDEALALVPQGEEAAHAHIWCMRGELHTVLGDKGNAIESYHHCAEWAAFSEDMAGLHEMAMAMIAELEQQPGEAASPIDIEEKPLLPEEDCPDVDACLEMAYANAEQGKFEIAITYIEQALDRRPGDEITPFAHLWCQMGEFRLELGLPDEAVNDFRMCLEWASEAPPNEDLKAYAEEMINNLAPPP
jgi:serine/threonine protein kinase